MQSLTIRVSTSHWGTFSPPFLRTSGKRTASSAAAGWRLQRSNAAERRTDEAGLQRSSNFGRITEHSTSDGPFPCILSSSSNKFESRTLRVSSSACHGSTRLSTASAFPDSIQRSCKSFATRWAAKTDSTITISFCRARALCTTVFLSGGAGGGGTHPASCISESSSCSKTNVSNPSSSKPCPTPAPRVPLVIALRQSTGSHGRTGRARAAASLSHGGGSWNPSRNSSEATPRTPSSLGNPSSRWRAPRRAQRSCRTGGPERTRAARERRRCGSRKPAEEERKERAWDWRKGGRVWKRMAGGSEAGSVGAGERRRRRSAAAG
uniref:Uncharacterized protein n=1 Tax=Arundo donax TaxID=35708 RepID=A0A0A9D330_ARUDO